MVNGDTESDGHRVNESLRGCEEKHRKLDAILRERKLLCSGDVIPLLRAFASQETAGLKLDPQSSDHGRCLGKSKADQNWVIESHREQGWRT